MGDAGLRGKMWAVYVLLISFWHLSTSQDCHVRVSQDKPIPRPKGRAVFTCVMPGVSYQELSAYQWFIAGYDTAVFTNFISFNTSSSSQEYVYMYIDQTVNKTGRFQSKLQVSLNITNAHVFKCEVHTKIGIFCAHSVRAQFHDPRISISSSPDIIPRMSPGETRVSVMCEVDRAAGVPELDISYRPATQDEFHAEEQDSEVTHHNLYYSGKQRGDLFVEEGGEIVCTVIDRLGTYRATHNIAIKGCPDSMKPRIQQHASARRPTDQVELTCTLTGVSLQELLYYRWLIHETDEILYTYSEFFNIARTTVSNTTVFQSETRETSARWIQSKLELRINLSFSQIIRFEMKTKNKDLCYTTSRIVVADPNVTMAVNDISGVSYTSREDGVLLVSCSIDAALGKPHLALKADGVVLGTSNNTSILEKHDFYYHGLTEETITMSRSGQIICIVRDELGTYTETTDIKVIHTEDRGRGHTSTILGISLPLSLVILMLLILIVIMISRARNLLCNERKQSYQGDIEMSEYNPRIETSHPKIHYLSQPRELSDVRKTGPVLELVWAYNNLESKRRCEKLYNNLLGLKLNAKKKNRRFQNSIDLSDTSGKCFVVMLWDEAAVHDEAFNEVAVQVNMFDITQENIIGIHVIMEEEANVMSIKDDEYFRYPLWLKKKESRSIYDLAKNIKSITQKQMSSLEGVNFIVEGLVWSCVAVYLKTVLGYIKKHAGIKKSWAGDNEGKHIHDRFLIIIPESGTCIPISHGCDEGCYRTEGTLCDIPVNDAGMGNRMVIHMVKADKTSQKEYYFIGEFANPVNTLHYLDDEEIVVDNDILVNSFEQRLRYILDHKIHGFREFYEIVRFHDESPGSPSLNNVLISHMTRSSPLIDSKADPISAPPLYVLGDCDGTDGCTIDQPKCGVHRVLAAMEDSIDINATLVTTSEFSQGALKRLLNNARQWKDMLCFVWNKHSPKYQLLQLCLKYAKQNSDVCSRVMHVETEPRSMPTDEKNVIKYHFEQTGDNHDRQRFQSDLKDLFMKEEDETLCGLVGIGLALSFFYSYIAYQVAGWNESLNKNKRHLKTLHDKLVIIIPQSGRSLDTIPGCRIIKHDKAKLAEYNAAQGDTAKLGEDYDKRPALWVKNKTAGRNYMTTIYEVGDDKQNYAAIEYATPVRTLYVMFNATHDTKSHKMGRLTQAWLTAEIDMLYKELKKLTSKAPPQIRDNVDLVYVEDGKLSELSEKDYKDKVSDLMVQGLQKLFHENKTG